MLKKTDYTGYVPENTPDRMLQFSEGGFLRAFLNYFFDFANEKHRVFCAAWLPRQRSRH